MVEPVGPSDESRTPRLEEELQKIDPDLNPKQRREILRLVAQRTYSGPIPPPEILQRFNEIIPNGADRIMCQMEDQVAHRIDIEKIIIISQQQQARLGQWCAFAIGVLGLTFEFISIVLSHDWAGVTLSGGAVVSLVYTFIHGKRDQREDLDLKRPK